MQSKYLIGFRYKRNPLAGPIISHGHPLQNTRPWLISGTSYYNAEFRNLRKGRRLIYEGKIRIWQFVLRLIEEDLVSDRYNLTEVSHTPTSFFQVMYFLYTLKTFSKPGAYCFRMFCKFIAYLVADVVG